MLLGFISEVLTFLLYHSVALVVRIVGIRQLSVVFELKLHILVAVLPLVSSAVPWVYR